MRHSTYLIVGGGMTAAAAVKGIRDVDTEGTITLISNEPDPPYKRPLLSKGLWQGTPLEKAWIKLDKYKVEQHLGRSVSWLNVQTKTAVDDRGDSFTFDKLLLATGLRPRKLSHGGENSIHFRTMHDYLRLRELTDRSQRLAIIGGGFIGSELAASLIANGQQVVMITNGAGIGDRLFPSSLVEFLNDYYRERGVEIRTEEEFLSREDLPDGIHLRTRNIITRETHDLLVDGVIAGIGAEPNVELAETAGLEVDDGIVVNEFLQTSHPDLFAAGDVAAVWRPELGVRRRFEHEDNALKMGRHAGRAMAGRLELWRHIPFFYSDLFDLGYEAVGEIDARLDTVDDWKEQGREGIIYYHRDGVIRGVLLWNVWGQVDAARELIANQTHVSDARLADLLRTAA